MFIAYVMQGHIAFYLFSVDAIDAFIFCRILIIDAFLLNDFHSDEETNQRPTL